MEHLQTVFFPNRLPFFLFFRHQKHLLRFHIELGTQR